MFVEVTLWFKTIMLGGFVMREIWKIIKSYPNYEVSNMGNVRNKKTKKKRKQALDIKTLLTYRFNPTEIGKIMNVSRRIVYHIRSKDTWTHLEGLNEEEI